MCRMIILCQWVFSEQREKVVRLLLYTSEIVQEILYPVSKRRVSGFGGLEVACWPLVPKFAGSNPGEAVGFFRAKKSSARLPSEGK